MKHTRLFLIVVALAFLGACTHVDLKSPCACNDGVKSRLNQEA